MLHYIKARKPISQVRQVMVEPQVSLVHRVQRVFQVCQVVQDQMVWREDQDFPGLWGQLVCRDLTERPVCLDRQGLQEQLVQRVLRDSQV